MSAQLSQPGEVIDLLQCEGLGSQTTASDATSRSALPSIKQEAEGTPSARLQWTSQPAAPWHDENAPSSSFNTPVRAASAPLPAAAAPGTTLRGSAAAALLASVQRPQVVHRFVVDVKDRKMGKNTSSSVCQVIEKDDVEIERIRMYRSFKCDACGVGILSASMNHCTTHNLYWCDECRARCVPNVECKYASAANPQNSGKWQAELEELLSSHNFDGDKLLVRLLGNRRIDLFTTISKRSAKPFTPAVTYKVAISRSPFFISGLYNALVLQKLVRPTCVHREQKLAELYEQTAIDMEYLDASRRKRTGKKRKAEGQLDATAVSASSASASASLTASASTSSAVTSPASRKQKTGSSPPAGSAKAHRWGNDSSSPFSPGVFSSEAFFSMLRPATDARLTRSQVPRTQPTATDPMLADGRRNTVLEEMEAEALEAHAAVDTADEADLNDSDGITEVADDPMGAGNSMFDMTIPSSASSASSSSLSSSSSSAVTNGVAHSSSSSSNDTLESIGGGLLAIPPTPTFPTATSNARARDVSVDLLTGDNVVPAATQWSPCLDMSQDRDSFATSRSIMASPMAMGAGDEEPSVALTPLMMTAKRSSSAPGSVVATPAPAAQLQSTPPTVVRESMPILSGLAAATSSSSSSSPPPRRTASINSLLLPKMPSTVTTVVPAAAPAVATPDAAAHRDSLAARTPATLNVTQNSADSPSSSSSSHASSPLNCSLSASSEANSASPRSSMASAMSASASNSPTVSSSTVHSRQASADAAPGSLSSSSSSVAAVSTAVAVAIPPMQSVQQLPSSAPSPKAAVASAPPAATAPAVEQAAAARKPILTPANAQRRPAPFFFNANAMSLLSSVGKGPAGSPYVLRLPPPNFGNSPLAAAPQQDGTVVGQAAGRSTPLHTRTPSGFVEEGLMAAAMPHVPVREWREADVENWLRNWLSTTSLDINTVDSYIQIFREYLVNGTLLLMLGLDELRSMGVRDQHIFRFTSEIAALAEPGAPQPAMASTLAGLYGQLEGTDDAMDVQIEGGGAMGAAFAKSAATAPLPATPVHEHKA